MGAAADDLRFAEPGWERSNDPGLRGSLLGIWAGWVSMGVRACAAPTGGCAGGCDGAVLVGDEDGSEEEGGGGTGGVGAESEGIRRVGRCDWVS